MNDLYEWRWLVTIRKILVQVDDAQACGARLTAAFELAAKFPAAVTGVYVPREVGAFVFAEGGMSASLYDEEVAMITADCAEAKSRFADVGAASGLKHAWCEVQGMDVDVLADTARFHDLLVLAQGDPSDPKCRNVGLPGAVVLAAGTPVLVIPPSGAASGLGQRVLIASNGSREGARAIRDSLPMLHLAREIHLLCVDGQPGNLAPLKDYLYAHGLVTISHELTPETGEIGETLLSQANAVRADLIVLGAYGHSRVREFVLGGATRSVLQGSTIPAFMTH
ncbi:MAG: nucleotide-binding universal stress UspA family protein [Gammaproteobacteria bacterium]|jgi:nucleotide-binding universal stress UspA family protein